MKFKINSRQILSASVIFFYLTPLLFFSIYSIGLMSRNKSWSILSLGLLMVACGALALILLLYYWEQSIRQKIQSENPIPSLPFETVISSLTTEKEPKVTSLDQTLILKEKEILDQDKKELTTTLLTLKDSQQQQFQLQEELESKLKVFKEKEEENKALLEKIEQISQDYSDYKIFSEEQLRQKSLQITNLQQTIEEQRAEVDKRLEQIHQLDSKVHDLSYEIKTLLHLNENETYLQTDSVLKERASSSSIDGSLLKESLHPYTATLPMQEEDPVFNMEYSVQQPSEALQLLKKCVNTAQKLTGAHYYGNESSRYRDLSSQHYTMDLRRLFDNLKTETGAIVFVYSQKENKVIFANAYCKSLLGISSEKFIQDFTALSQQLPEWKKSLNELSNEPYSELCLMMKSKNGQDLFLQCHLGIIPTGLFRHYIIGTLFLN